jgi:hypothetical protein
MDYMHQSMLETPLRLLCKVEWKHRKTWVDILATIAAHCKESTSASRTSDVYITLLGMPDFPDTYTILFEIAKHDIHPKVQRASLKSLKQLAIARYCKFYSHLPQNRILLT